MNRERFRTGDEFLGSDDAPAAWRGMLRAAWLSSGMWVGVLWWLWSGAAPVAAACFVSVLTLLWLAGGVGMWLESRDPGEGRA
jgi:hypothetical protein